MSGHTQPVTALCSATVPSSSSSSDVATVLLAASASPDSCVRVFESAEWEQIMTLKRPDAVDEKAVPTSITCQSTPDALVVVGFADGSLAGYKLSTSSPAFYVSDVVHVVAVDAVV